MPKPVFVTARLPFRQVLLIDGTSAELRREHGLSFGKAVQPIHQLPAHFTVAQTDIQLVANLARQPGNFSKAGRR